MKRSRLGSICLILFLNLAAACAQYQAQGSYLGLLLLSGKAPTVAETVTTNQSWKQRIKVTFNNVGRGALVNFPVTIRLTNARTPFSKIALNGADLRVVDCDASTNLSYEIAWWDATLQQAEIHAKVPQIDANSSTDCVYVYYSNPSVTDGQTVSSVWSEAYSGVYHFVETTGAYTDSTGAHNSTAVNVTSRANVIGIVGNNAPRFQNDDVRLGTWSVTPSGAGNDGITFETFVKFSSFAFADARILSKSTTGVADSDHTWNLTTLGALLRMRLSLSGTTIVLVDAGPTGPLATGTWYHVVGVYRGAGMFIYLDSTVVESNANVGTPDTNGQEIWVGKHPDGSRPLDGAIEELRISSIGRSADWISASNATFRDTMQTYGAEENL